MHFGALLAQVAVILVINQWEKRFLHVTEKNPGRNVKQQISGDKQTNKHSKYFTQQILFTALCHICNGSNLNVAEKDIGVIHA